MLLQTLTRNPMASPEVLGISSGVALAVLAAFIAFPALGSGGLLLVLVALMSTAATLAVGPLSFIGLMTPHLARRSGAVSIDKQLPVAALYGAALMLVADWLGRYLIFPYEIGAGVLASPSAARPASASPMPPTTPPSRLSPSPPTKAASPAKTRATTPYPP